MTRKPFQRGLEIPFKDSQGSRAEDSESSDSDGTEQPGGDPVVKLPMGQGRQGIPEVHTFGEGGTTSKTGEPGSGSTFLTEDKYQSLVAKIDQNLLTFQKATEVFQTSMQTMTDSFKTLSEEVKNQSSRIEILEGQVEKAQQQSTAHLTNSAGQLASDILAKAIENLNVPFDRATVIAKSLEEAARVPLITEDSLKAALNTISKVSERRLNDEFSSLSARMVQQFDSTLSSQVTKFNAVLDSNKLTQQRELSSLFNSAKADFLQGVQGSLASFIEGPLTRRIRSELTGVTTELVKVLNDHIASCPSLPAQQFAAASTEQQKGESSKATELAEELRRQKEEEAERKLAEDAGAEADAKTREDRAAFHKATKETHGVQATEEPTVVIEIATESSSSSDDQHPISEAIKKMRQKKQGEASGATHRTEPEGPSPADEQRKMREEELKKKKEEEIQRKEQEEEQRKRKGKSRVEDIMDSMESLKPKPTRVFTELQREFPERVFAHLYSRGRESYSYFTLFPVKRTADEVKFIRSVMKNPRDIFTNIPIKPIPVPEVTVITSSKGILNVKFKVTREDGTEMRFSDVDLLNLCPYDLHDLYGIMFNHEGKHRKFSLAKLKILQAMRDCVRMNARRDFELALTLGLDQTDLNPPDEDLYDLQVTEPYLPVPEANGMSYLNEEGEIKIYRVDNCMKYSNDTLLFLYNELTLLNKKLTPQQLQTKKNLIESFQGQLNYRRHIMILVGILKSIKEEAKILEKMLAEKPIFDRT